MKKMTLLSLLVLVGFMFSGAQTVLAQTDVDPDPEAITQECVQKIKGLADECSRHIAEIAQNCLPRIRHLIEEGKLEEAKRLAHHCIYRIERIRKHCIADIHQICRRCIHVLLELERPDLARRVKEVCGESVAQVNHTAARAIKAIRNLFASVDTSAG